MTTIGTNEPNQLHEYLRHWTVWIKRMLVQSLFKGLYRFYYFEQKILVN